MVISSGPVPFVYTFDVAKYSGHTRTLGYIKMKSKFSPGGKVVDIWRSGKCPFVKTLFMSKHYIPVLIFAYFCSSLST